MKNIFLLPVIWLLVGSVNFWGHDPNIFLINLKQRCSTQQQHKQQQNSTQFSQARNFISEKQQLIYKYFSLLFRTGYKSKSTKKDVDAASGNEPFKQNYTHSCYFHSSPSPLFRHNFCLFSLYNMLYVICCCSFYMFVVCVVFFGAAWLLISINLLPSASL